MRKLRYWSVVSSRAVAIGTIAGPAISQSVSETFSGDALGRLVQIDRSGGENDGKIISTCFDPVGDRTRYDLTSSAPAASPMSTTPANALPVTELDAVSVFCKATTTANLVVNDSYPENEVPLSLMSIETDSIGSASIAIMSSRSVSITGSSSAGTANFLYVVQDSLGAQSSDVITAPTCGSLYLCDGGGL